MIIALGKNTENKMKTFAAFLKNLTEAGHFAQQVHTVPVKEFPNQNDPNKLKPYGGIPKWAQANEAEKHQSYILHAPGDPNHETFKVMTTSQAKENNRDWKANGENRVLIPHKKWLETKTTTPEFKRAQKVTESERSSGGKHWVSHTVDTKYHGIAQHHGLTWKRGGPHSGDYEGRNHTLYADHGAWTVQDHMGKELGKGKTCQSAHEFLSKLGGWES
jgi:hypothetical protein